MGSYSILFLIIPLLVFVLVDTFASLNVALIATILVALAECLFSYIRVGELDSFSLFSIFLVLLLAALSYSKKSRRIFYLKPAILSLGLGLYLIITYFMDQYVLYDGMLKYGSLLPEANSSILQTEQFQQVLKHSSLTIGLASFFSCGVGSFRSC